VRAVSFDEARTALEAHLSEKAARHCLRCSDAAVALALVYGVDADAARLAGLLHDWAREDTDEGLLGDARQHRIEITVADEEVPHLLHARVGAAQVREAFPGIGEDVVVAIERHTLGEREMTSLDMVVYLADMIEPHRAHAGVEELRDAVGGLSLCELFARGYQQSLRHVVDARKSMHPVTVEAWNAHVARPKDRG
jgi:predicted HD superfamily hydrolase involved in NAD metabolism